MESFDTDHSEETVEQKQDQNLTFSVGDKEYDAEAATKKISSADEHISKIERENAELRAKVEKSLSEDAIQARIDEALQKLNATSKPESRSQEPTSSFDPEKLSAAAKEAALAALKEEKHKEQEAMSKAQQEKTFKETQKQLKDMFGDKVDESVQQMAGVSMERALEMARDPEMSKVLIRLCSKDGKGVSVSPEGDKNIASLLANKKQENVFEGKTKVSSKDIIGKLLNP